MFSELYPLSLEPSTTITMNCRSPAYHPVYSNTLSPSLFYHIILHAYKLRYTSIQGEPIFEAHPSSLPANVAYYNCKKQGKTKKNYEYQ